MTFRAGLDKRLPKYNNRQSLVITHQLVLYKQMFKGIPIFRFSATKRAQANLIKDYLRMLQTKFGDHPSFKLVEEDVPSIIQ
jgi:hypothetical protein